MAQKRNGKNNGLKIHKKILKGIGRTVLYIIPIPMAVDAEQSSGKILQKVDRIACSPEIVSPTAGDIWG